MCAFKHSSEKVRLKIHPGKNEDSQHSSSTKEMEIDDIKVEILTREESTK